MTLRLRANSWFNCWRFWLLRFTQRVSSSQRLPFTTSRMGPPLRKNSARRTSSTASLACCLDAFSPTFRQLRSEKLIERFLLAVLPEPQRLAGLQVADHGDELRVLAKVDLIHTHLFQRLLAPRGTPSLEIPQVDRSHRAGGHAELPGHLAYRGAFARQPHRVFKALAKRRFTRQLRDPLDLDPTLRTAHPVHFDDYRRSIFAPRQVAYFPFVIIMSVGKLSSASRTDKFAVAAFPPHPQPQRLGGLIDLVPKDSVARPT